MVNQKKERDFSTPFRVVFLMWLVFSIEHFLGIELGGLGIYPREWFGLIGVITSPLIHGSFTHIVSNTLPMIFLGGTIFYFYPKIARQIFYLSYLITGLLVWLFARQVFHIGASGLIYGLASFLIFYGFFRRDFKSLIISIIILLLYDGFLLGMLPNQLGISWESHLFGGVVGGILAYFYRKS